MPIHSSQLPRGIIAYNNAGSVVNTATGTTLVQAVTLTATLSPSRLYRVAHDMIHAQSTDTTPPDYANVFILQSAAGGAVSAASTQIAQVIISCPTVSGLRDGKANETLLNAPAAGVYQFGIYFARVAASPAGTISLGTSAGARLLWLYVEDMGPARSATP